MANASVRLSAALPDGDRNGLPAIVTRLVDDPEAVHVAIVLLDCRSLLTNVADASVLPTAGIRAIEPIGTGPDAAELQRLLRRAYERRTGQTELPLELERALDNLAGPAGFGDTTVAEELAHPHPPIPVTLDAGGGQHVADPTAEELAAEDTAHDQGDDGTLTDADVDRLLATTPHPAPGTHQDWHPAAPAWSPPFQEPPARTTDGDDEDGDGEE